ncbi:MAG: glycine cleavage system aminomethyltransferase GcvT, partial [Proteobacteria bacterium]
NKFNAKIENKSAAYGQIALQGPQAQAILQKLNGASSACELKYFCFCEAELGGCQAIIARTGYTGEDGFEFFMPWDGAPAVWNLLLEQGEGLGLLPCGLGARDSLRLEACYPLHGHELSDEISALESGLGWIVKFDKGDFIGKQALQRQKDSGLKRNLIGFYVDDPGIARHGDKVYAEDGASEIGVVTSGTKTPTLSRALGMALVDAAHSKVDSKIAVDVRGRKLSCSVVKKPFYKRG